jgi:hypothetical protein
METLLRYRGRPVTPTDVHFTRKLIAARPRLSLRLCKACGWRLASGAPPDLVARGVVLALCRTGQSNVAGHLDFPVKCRWAARDTGATSIREASALPLPDCTGAVTRKLSTAPIKKTCESLTLFGTVATSHAFPRALRERLETELHTTPRSYQ